MKWRVSFFGLFSVVLQWMKSMTQWQLFTMTLIYLVVSYGTP